MAVTEESMTRDTRRIRSREASPKKTEAIFSSWTGMLPDMSSETQDNTVSISPVQASIAFDRAASARAGLQLSLIHI